MSLFINICEIVFTVQSGITYFVKEKIPALSGALIALILKKQGWLMCRFKLHLDNMMVSQNFPVIFGAELFEIVSLSQLLGLKS